MVSTDFPSLVDIKIEKTVKSSIDLYFWKGNISKCRQYFEEEKIKRSIVLVLTFYRKIRTLTMVIR